MPSYDYECKKCKTIYSLSHSIKDDAFEKYKCPKCKSVQKCKRLITFNHAGIKFKGDGWTVPSSGYGKRGYKGKFGNLIRKEGSPVDAPSRKDEADKQFQRWIDTGGLDGIKPDIDLNATDFANKPMTTEEALDKGKK